MAAGAAVLQLGLPPALAAPAGTGVRPGVPSAAAGLGHGTGLKPTVVRLTAAKGLATARRDGVAVAAAAVPAAVDLTGYAPTPGNQGAVSSCVAWSAGYTMQGWYANYQKHAGAPFAPMYLYTQINGGRDAGATIPSAWGVLEAQGIAEQAVYTQGNYDWSSRPTTAQTMNAAAHRTASHAYLFSGDNQGTTGQNALQAALANGQPVEIGIPVHSGFGGLSPTNQVWHLSDTLGRPLQGYHAIVAVGYDSTGLRIENSWGTGWGAAGFATLSWDFVNRYVMEASVGTGFARTDAPSAPQVTKLSRATVSAAGGDTVTVTGTRLSTVDITRPDAVRLVNVADPSVTARLAVTAATATTITATTTAVPTGATGLPVTGAYKVVLTGSGGTSPLTDAAAAVNVVTPYVVTAEPGATALSTGGTKLTLTGAGFGTSTAAYAGNQVAATVNGAVAPVSWVSDTRIMLTMPTGAVGSYPSIVVTRAGIGGPVLSTVRYVAPAPSVTRVTPAVVSSAGGDPVTLSVTQAGTVEAGNAAAVLLVNVANPAVSVPAQVTAITASTITIRTPAAQLTGPYRVMVTGSGGSSGPNGSADQLSVLTPYQISVPPGAQVSAAGYTALPVTGSGFGAGAAAFAANQITATVNGRPATLSWVSDRRVLVVVPAGVPGATASVALQRAGLAGPADNTARYAAVISGSTAPAGPAAGGWVTTLTGVGFARSGSWALLDSAGNVVAALPVGTNADTLDPGTGGVVPLSPTQARVKLPPAPGGVPGVYSLTFTPDQAAFPGARAALSSKAVVVYTEVG